MSARPAGDLLAGAVDVRSTAVASQRRENVFGLLVSLTMLLEVGDALDFTAADFRSWCSEAGFQRFAVLPLGGPASAAIAYK
jgi:hypothetical protein